MFSCTRHETHAFREGKAIGAVRRYDGPEGCPHEAGAEIMLSSKFIPGNPAGQEVVFAKAKVVSVRPGTVMQFRKDKMLAEQDGFGSSPSWHGHLVNILYKGIRDDAKVYHVTFRIEEMVDQLAEASV